MATVGRVDVQTRAYLMTQLDIPLDTKGPVVTPDGEWHLISTDPKDPNMDMFQFVDTRPTGARLGSQNYPRMWELKGDQ